MCGAEVRYSELSASPSSGMQVSICIGKLICLFKLAFIWQKFVALSVKEDDMILLPSRLRLLFVSFNLYGFWLVTESKLCKNEQW